MTVVEMENFYSRCLLCTCIPDLTPHLNIFSGAGNKLQLSEKINKYLNIQIDGDLPQNVCHSCMEKLEVTHELVTSSQQASITLLHIRQQAFVHEVKQENLDCSETELDSYQPAIDTIYSEIDIKTDELHTDISDSDSSSNDVTAQLDEEPIHILFNTRTTEADLDVEETEIILPVKAKRVQHDYGGAVTCDICNERVKHQYCLIQHKNLKHNLNLPFNCEHCSKNCLNLKKVMQHIRYKHANNGQVCKVCGKSFTKRWYPSHVKNHQVNNTPKLLREGTFHPVECGMCSYRARNKFFLLNHINCEHLDVVVQPLPFWCELCDKQFPNCNKLLYHLRKVHRPKLQCKHCGKMLTRFKMAQHLMLHQPGKKKDTAGNQEQTEPFEQVLIPEGAAKTLEPREDQLDRFSQSAHDAAEHSVLESQLLMQCDLCSFCINNKTQLESHVLAHLTPKTSAGTKSKGVRYLRIHKCAHCKLSYAHAEILAWHIENCHGTDATVRIVKTSDSRHHKLQCVLCDTVFKKLEFIISHLHVKHKIINLPFKCNKCEKTFVRRKHCRSHEIKCAGSIKSNEVKCRTCNKVFKSIYQRRTHISKLHARQKSHGFKCEHCDEIFRFFHQLKSHCLDKHPGSYILKCELCMDREFMTHQGYRFHKQQKHSN